MHLSEPRLKAAVAGAGAVAESEDFEVETVVLRMNGLQQDRLDRGIALARELIGHDRARWQCEEAIAQEVLGSYGLWTRDSGLPDSKNRVERRALKKDWRRLWSGAYSQAERGHPPQTLQAWTQADSAQGDAGHP